MPEIIAKMCKLNVKSFRTGPSCSKFASCSKCAFQGLNCCQVNKCVKTVLSVG